MFHARQCIICGSTRMSNYRARIAPFISARVFSGSAPRTSLYRCDNCNMSFFDLRFENKEMEALYSNYRAPEYQKQRQCFEPDYTVELNMNIGNNPIELKNRNDNLLNILSQFTDLNRIKSILDYGGDKGQFIPPQLKHTDRYVYEISGTPPIDGIHQISTPNQLQGKTFDLILCNHVLEHVSNPSEIISEIKRFARPSTLLYVELPVEGPFRDEPSLSGPLKKMILASTPGYQIFKIMRSIIWSIKGYKTITGHMHEHINLFTIEALSTLLQIQGFTPLMAAKIKFNLGWTQTEHICCLAKL